MKIKQVKFYEIFWQEIEDFRRMLADERGGYISIPSAVIEAVRIAKVKRPKLK